MVIIFFFKELLERLPQAGSVGYQGAQLVQIAFIGRTRDPKLDITVDRILLIHVLFETKPLVITVQLRIVGKTELYGTTHNHIDRDVPVCLCHNTPIDAAGSMTGRCAMILNGFFHDLYLVC